MKCQECSGTGFVEIDLMSAFVSNNLSYKAACSTCRGSGKARKT